VRGRSRSLAWSAALEETEALLKSAARDNKLLTYTELASSITTFDLEPRSTVLARLLCDLFFRDLRDGGPILASLVVNQRSGRPGKGFFRLARHFCGAVDDEEFWLGQVTAAFDEHSPVRSKHRRPKAPAIHSQATPADDEKINDFIMSFFD
jgi:hypothetical protein